MTSPHRLWLALALAFAGALGVYAWGAAPTVLTGDSAEIQAVGLLGGVAHPTGYPTAILVGHVFGRLVPGDQAHRVTLMSAVFGGVAVTLLLRLLVELGLSLRGAFAGAMLYGSTYTFWSSALRAEVYTLSLSLALVAIWRTVVALRSGRTGPSLAAGALLGLTLTGHLAFALPVGALGLALAWRLSRASRRPVGSLAALAGAFLLGLTPYLYLVWADTQSFAMNYLRYVDLGLHPLGPRPEYFDSPWERVWWLISARNQLPPEPLIVLPRALARGLFEAATQFGLFEPGPLGIVLALTGLRRHLRTPGAAGGWFVALCSLSIGFASVLGSGMLTAVFLMPATLVIAIWAAFGLEALMAWGSSRSRWARAATAALVCLLPVLVALPAHGLRVYTRHHRIGPLRLQIHEEVDRPGRGFVPSLRGYREPRRYGEAVLAAAPESALVIGEWPELMTLFYLRHVEGRRPDLSYQSFVYPNLLPRLERWQERQDFDRHPFVLVSWREELGAHLVAMDSVSVGADRWIHVHRKPMVGLGRRP